MEKLELSAVIIDDESDAIYLLEDLLIKFLYYQIKISGTATNLDQGIELIKRCQPDIVFLDIHMPGKKGIEIYDEFKSPQFKIIFCTGHSDYAIDIFRKNACAYLLKPIDSNELHKSLIRVAEEIMLEQKHQILEDKISILNTPKIIGKDIVLHVENGFTLCNTRNIEYCYASKTTSVVVTYGKNEIVVTKVLKDLQEMLPENQFYRTHKSYLVNIYYIRKFVRAKESYVVMESGVKIPVSLRTTTNIAKDIRNKLMVK